MVIATIKPFTGLDRIQNAHGYRLWNVAPCCFQCNHMKGAQTPDAFLSKVHDIASNVRFEESGKYYHSPLDVNRWPLDIAPTKREVSDEEE